MNVRHTYLATLVDGGGTVPVELGAVRRLVDRGHHVLVLAEDTMHDEVRAAGATFLPWTQAPNRPTRRPEDDPYRDWECKGMRQLFKRLLETQLLGPAAAYAADTTRAIGKHRPDALLGSIFAVGALTAAEAADLPFAVLMPNLYPLPARGLPPFGSGMGRAHTPFGRGLHALVSTLTTRMFDSGLPRLNALRSSYSLPPLRHFWDQVAAADQQVVLTSADFDFPADLPEGVRYVGPVLDDPTWTEPWTPPTGDDPLVLVAMSSTYMEQHVTLRSVVDALGTLGVRGVVTTGPALDPSAVAAPDNVTVLASAPHGEVLRHASVVVTHGGHGTVMKSLAADVPMVVMPHGRDQKDNGVRVVGRGAGVMLRRDASSRQVAAAVRRLIDDDRYREAARRLGAAVRRDAGSQDLVRSLEELPFSADRSQASRVSGSAPSPTPPSGPGRPARSGPPASDPRAPAGWSGR